MYDAIVIGARCAGAPTAMLLARKGYRTLLVDRAHFPSDIPQGIFIHRHGPRLLQKWGLLERVVAGGTPPIDAFLTDYGDFPLVGRDLASDGVAFAYAPRRTLLDEILVDAAVVAGAEVREGFAVDDFLVEGNRVVGIRGHDVRARRTVTETARITIGADGRNSRLARAVQAPFDYYTPPLTCYYFSYWSGVPAVGIEMYRQPGRLIIVHKTSGGLTAILAVCPYAEMATFRTDLEGNYRRMLATVPSLEERLSQGRREEVIYGNGDLPNFLRKPYGPGWALVGDAGCSKDPYLALGICDAFRDAGSLVDAIDRGLAGACPLDVALADYESRRNAAVLPDYESNLQNARLQPFPPEVMRMRAALRGDQDLTNRFYRADEGLIPREEFFNQPMLRRLLRRSQVLV